MNKAATESFLAGVSNWFEQLWIQFTNSDWFLVFDIFIILVAAVAVYFLIKFTIFVINGFRGKRYCISVQHINVFNTNIRIDKSNVDIAYKIYTQLSTRKIGIPFEEDDVIVEVYNSWFKAFGIIRDLLLLLPPISKNKEIINIGNQVLNKGMRPHLTKWQAKFRRWYDHNIKIEEDMNISPQEIQRKYPQYTELVADMQESQKEILDLLSQLENTFNFQKLKEKKKH